MKNIFILLFIALAFTSCDTFLDVKPTGSLIPKTLEDYDKLMGSPWAISKGPDNMVYMDPDIYMPGKSYADLAGNIANQKQYSWADDFFKPEDDDSDWNNRYNLIHIVNEIIANVDGASAGNFAESKRKLVKGEALAHRAMEYFLLVNEYAPHYSLSTVDEPSVPLSLKVDLTASLPKSSIGDVYTQIIEDLEEADRLMVDAKAFDHKINFRPRKAAVKALLAMVHLFMNNPDDAAIYSNDALDLYDFIYDWSKIEHMVEGNPWEGFNFNNGEILNLYGYGTDSKSYLWQKSARFTFGYPANRYHPNLVDLFDKSNDRRWILQNSHITNLGFDVSPDYVYARGNAEDCNGISVGNLYLINAEAKVRSGDGEGAVDRLNKLRVKRFTAPYTPLVHVDNTTTLQWVKDERRR